MSNFRRCDLRRARGTKRWVFGPALFFLVACSGGDDNGSTTSSVATTVAPASTAAPDTDAVGAYFDAFATDADPSIAAAGTSAALYAEHQSVARALIGDVAARSVSGDGQQFVACTTSGDCAAYTDIRVDPASGLPSSFSVDGSPIEGRVGPGGSVVAVDDVRARGATSLVAANGQLTVVVEVENASGVDVRLFPFAAVYQHGSGFAARDAVGAWGDDIVPTGTTGRFLVAFDGEQPGGRLRFTALREDGVDIEFDLEVPAA